MYNNWRDIHGGIIKDFLLELNNVSKNYILKGGTSLMMCYGLDRFSEDIDLDAFNTKAGIEKFVDNFCNSYGYTYRVAKNTDTVKRYMIHYGGDKPLKVEISYRRKNISENEITIINNILVYNVCNILIFKLNAYNGRDKIRDLYDVTFICRNYWKIIPDVLKIQVQDALSFKGLEYFDMIIKTQSDELIDKNKLASDFLDLYNLLGLM